MLDFLVAAGIFVLILYLLFLNFYELCAFFLCEKYLWRVKIT